MFLACGYFVLYLQTCLGGSLNSLVLKCLFLTAPYCIRLQHTVMTSLAYKGTQKQHKVCPLFFKMVSFLLRLLHFT